MNEEIRKKRDELIDSHSWSLECTCEESDNCYYHLTDPEKSGYSYSHGFDAGYSIGIEKHIEDLIDIAACTTDSILRHSITAKLKTMQENR